MGGWPAAQSRRSTACPGHPSTWRWVDTRRTRDRCKMPPTSSLLVAVFSLAITRHLRHKTVLAAGPWRLPIGRGRSSGVEHHVANVRVVSSNLIARSIAFPDPFTPLTRDLRGHPRPPRRVATRWCHDLGATVLKRFAIPRNRSRTLALCFFAFSTTNRGPLRRKMLQESDCSRERARERRCLVWTVGRRVPFGHQESASISQSNQSNAVLKCLTAPTLLLL